MTKYDYKPETLANLSRVLIKDTALFASSAFTALMSVVAAMAGGCIIPWEKRDEILSEYELVDCIKQYVLSVMHPYKGSWSGHRSWQEGKWLVLSLLFGKGAADSLLKIETGKDIDIEYENGAWSLKIPGYQKSEEGRFYNVQMLRWCRRMAPVILTMLPENEFMDVMIPVYYEYGYKRVVLLKEYAYTDDDFEGIRKMAFEQPNAKIYPIVTVENSVSRLEWVIKNASGDELPIIQKCEWDTLCEAMEEEWEAYKDEMYL